MKSFTYSIRYAGHDAARATLGSLRVVPTEIQQDAFWMAQHSSVVAGPRRDEARLGAQRDVQSLGF